MKDFRELKVWEKAHHLTLEIYKMTAEFPKEEQFGITSQIRRAATSIGLNIAEGCGRGSDADFKRFLFIALGSATETEYCLQLALDLHYIPNDLYVVMNDQINEMKKMLYAFTEKLKEKQVISCKS
jgi:four helix bundle protein